MAPSPRRLSSSSSSAVDAITAEASELVALEQATGGLLPSDLEARFRKLKSFSATVSRSPEKHGTPRRLDRPESPPISPTDDQDRKVPTRSSPEGDQDQNFPAPETSEKPEHKSKSDLGSSSSFDSSKETLPSSPPKQCCCFVFTPKKVVAQSRRAKGGDVLPGSNAHAQLRKSHREQEKLTREAAKMVRWARQASRRMNAGSMDEFLSHGEEEFK